MATAAAARGPLNALLSNASTQWIALGIGIYAFGPDHLRDAVHRAILAISTIPEESSQQQQFRSASPVIVRVDPSMRGGGGGNRWIFSIVSYTAVAGCVWLSYSVLSTVLPEQLQQVLPVTRRIFEKSSKSLAKTIFNVKEVLGNQITALLRKQEDLESHQKESHKEILNVKESLQNAHRDIQTVDTTTRRCEDDLKKSMAMQGYTARGVKLLVTAVSSILDPNNRISHELEDYIRAGDLIYGKSTRPNDGPENDRPVRPSTPPKKTITPKIPTTPDDGTIHRIQQGKWLEATH